MKRLSDQPESLMRVLALNPFHGGSHRAFLEGWMRHSRHEFTLLTLRDRQWKWRMRQAAIHFAEKLNEPAYAHRTWDVLWVTDMLNLAEFRGLSRHDVSQLPSVLYFHENQLTYPSRQGEDDRQRDLHFGVTNIVSALSADSVWWNSRFHHNEFLTAIDELSRRVPDRTFAFAADTIRDKSCICPPGVDRFSIRDSTCDKSPTHLLWAARWEHDKQPELFFAALEHLAQEGLPFEISVIGQSYQVVPDCFAVARERFSDRIRHWGYIESHQEYRTVLQSADIYVSTASHEFFGIAAVEAIMAGCYPLLPHRLAYPELIEERGEFLYEGDSQSLYERLAALITSSQQEHHLMRSAEQARHAVERFSWERLAPLMDDRINELSNLTR